MSLPQPFLLEGSYFVASASDSERVATLLSSDKTLLALIEKGRDALFRVHVFNRTTEPGLIGTWWSEAGSPSLVSTLEDATALARQRLEAVEQ
jgi:hypothetical protein